MTEMVSALLITHKKTKKWFDFYLQLFTISLPHLEMNNNNIQQYNSNNIIITSLIYKNVAINIKLQKNVNSKHIQVKLLGMVPNNSGQITLK